MIDRQQKGHVRRAGLARHADRAHLVGRDHDPGHLVTHARAHAEDTLVHRHDIEASTGLLLADISVLFNYMLLEGGEGRGVVAKDFESSQRLQIP